MAISRSLSTAMNDWPIRALLPFYWVLTAPRSAEADKQQMRCPVDDAAVTQFILLLFLNRKRRAESKQGLGNANTGAMPKQPHKRRFSLLSGIKFNFWGHAAVFSLFKCSENGFTARGDAVEISLRRTHTGKKCWLRRKLSGLSRIAIGLLGFF